MEKRQDEDGLQVPGYGKPLPESSLQPEYLSKPSVIDNNGTAVKCVRVIVSGAGAIILAILGLVPPTYALIALVAIAMPTNAGYLLSLFKTNPAKEKSP